MPLFRLGLIFMLIGLPLLGILHSVKVIITGRVKVESKAFFITTKTDIYEGNVARRFGAITAIGYILILVGFSLSTLSIFSDGTYLTYVCCSLGLGFNLFGFMTLSRADRQITND